MPLNNKRIYLSPPHMSGQELSFVKDAIDSNWVAPLGPHVDAFENEIKNYIGVNSALALSSGTAALHLALKCCDVQPKDIVFCSDLTFIASANVIRYVDAKPVFIDSDWKTWTMCPQALQIAFDDSIKNNQLPKAVIVTDLYGQSADYGKLTKICDDYNVSIIEDAAEALGGVYNNQKCGSFGKMAALSFNGNKIITTSGGGMLLSNDSEMISLARKLATQAREDAIHYEHHQIGYNYRLSNILAALGRGQLSIIKDRVETRRKIFSIYFQKLSHINGIDFMPEASYGVSNRWLTVFTVDPGKKSINRDTIISILEKENIEARPIWKPMHLQPLYKNEKLYYCSKKPNSEMLFQNGICLPSGSSLSGEDQDKIINIILEYCYK